MGKWDAKDNSIQEKIQTKYRQCEICGAMSFCVSDAGMLAEERAEEYVCNHCFDEISGNSCCISGSYSCEGCIHNE